MNLITSHPAVSALIAYFVFSAVVDAINKVPPVAGDSRLYVFAYTLVNGLAGNLLTALSSFLSKK